MTVIADDSLSADMIHACNPSTSEVEAGQLYARPAYT